MRKGVQPDTNALAFVLVTLAVIGGTAYEIVQRRAVRRAEVRARAAIRAEEAVMITPAAARVDAAMS